MFHLVFHARVPVIRGARWQHSGTILSKRAGSASTFVDGSV